MLFFGSKNDLKKNSRLFSLFFFFSFFSPPSFVSCFHNKKQKKMTSIYLRDYALRHGVDNVTSCEIESHGGDVIVGFLMTLGAGLSTAIGALFSFCIPQDGEKGKIFLSVSLALAAGVMLYISFVEIYVEKTFDSFAACVDEDLVSTYASLCFFLGVILTWCLNFVVHRFERYIFKKEESEVTHEDLEQNDKKDDIVDFEDKMALELFSEEETQVNQGDLARMGLFTAIAIALHNFPEGLATFVAAMGDETLGLSVAFAIALHNIPEGICVAVPVYFASKSKTKAFLVAAASGLTELLGAFLGWLVLMEVFNQVIFGILFGLVSGMMIYVSIAELLPQARKFDPNDRWSSIMCFVGMFVMALSLMVFDLIGQHD